MINQQQVRVATHAVNGSSDPGALEGARRASGNAPGSGPSANPGDLDSEVIAKPAKRNHRSNAEKRRILRAVEKCTRPGEVGALLRREGIYSSSLSTWKRQLEAVELEALAPKKRGPKVDPNRAEAQHIAKLTREVERLNGELSKARLVIEVQKKLSSLLGQPIDDETGRS